MTTNIFETVIGGVTLSLEPGFYLLSDAGSDDGCGDYDSRDGGFADDLAELVYLRARDAEIDTDCILESDGSIERSIEMLDFGVALGACMWVNEFPSRRKLRALKAAVDPDQVFLAAIANADAPIWYREVDGLFDFAINSSTRPGYRETRKDGGHGDPNLFLPRQMSNPNGLSFEELTA